MEVNGQEAVDWRSIQGLILRQTDNVVLKVDRGGQTMDFTIPLQNSEVLDDYGRKQRKNIIGVAPTVHDVKFNPLTGFTKSVSMIFETTWFMLKGFAMIIIGALPFKEAVSGPIGIYHITAQAREAGFTAILHFMAILNISLMIINLMPFPIMDGGHIVLFLLEKIRRRGISEKTEDVLTRIGIALIAVLMVFVFYNDIVKFGPKIFGGKKAAVEKKV